MGSAEVREERALMVQKLDVRQARTASNYITRLGRRLVASSILRSNLHASLAFSLAYFASRRDSFNEQQRFVETYFLTEPKRPKPAMRLDERLVDRIVCSRKLACFEGGRPCR